MLPFSRRDVLKSAPLAIGGPLGLADIFRRQAAAHESDAKHSETTSVIFVTLGGGPSQFESFDPKPAAPVEYRGTFEPIQTSLPGVQFCELFPNLARIADQLAIVRSIHHEQASHIAEHIVETGFDLTNFAKARNGEMPSIGSVVSRLRGTGSTGIPAYISIPRHHAYSGPQWVGAQHHFFPIDGDPNQNTFAVDNLVLTGALNANRLRERRGLQSAFGNQRPVSDRNGEASTIDAFSQQAFDLITSERSQRAFNIAAEDPRLRERYGRNDFGQRLLLARRLVEAGVPYITVRTFDWDDHDKLATRMKQRCPATDQGIATLIEDLRDRGLSRNVLVVAMGEFGRTPRVNQNAGRDHYPAVNNVLIAGGNYRKGQVIGATDRLGAQVTHSPYRPPEFYHDGLSPSWYRPRDVFQRLFRSPQAHFRGTRTHLRAALIR